MAQEEHATLFQPPLPAAKADLIANLGMGIVDKIFVTFYNVAAGVHPRRSVLSYQLLWKVTVPLASSSCLLLSLLCHAQHLYMGEKGWKALILFCARR